jgi:membrane protein YdbS with pleckstrin-like domain
VQPNLVDTLQKNVYYRTMMENQLGLVLKLLLLSALLSLLIKYVGPSLSIPATSTNALIIILLPIVIIAIALLWRFQVQKQN